ncbi:putative inositol 5-phosphatase 1 [Paratrimastix pyriformis]|uniref:Inositol 5-phosphatase 1 n=1 Tax=Paratrimastix pyriformis TaxID=342808 RepID=A0ABQ8UG99_9EUKA|nr:putative inositol 5-phosphatase 1 [Paratrimastix pyriformis]
MSTDDLRRPLSPRAGVDAGAAMHPASAQRFSWSRGSLTRLGEVWQREEFPGHCGRPGGEPSAHWAEFLRPPRIGDPVPAPDKATSSAGGMPDCAPGTIPNSSLTCNGFGAYFRVWGTHVNKRYNRVYLRFCRQYLFCEEMAAILDMQRRKEAEADNEMKEGIKMMGTTLFRWKPDFDTAKDHFDRAAVCYKTANLPDKAIEAYKRASEACYKGERYRLFPLKRQRNLEKAAVLASTTERAPQAAALYTQASRLFRENANPDKAAEMLMKGARSLEQSNPEEAANLVNQAIEVYETEDRDVFSEDAFRLLIAIEMRAGRVQECIGVMRRRLEMCVRLGRLENAYKCVLGMVCMHLHLGDTVAAQAVYTEFHELPNFLGTEEDISCSEFISACDQHDEDAFTRAKARQVVVFLDPLVAKLAKPAACLPLDRLFALQNTKYGHKRHSCQTSFDPERIIRLSVKVNAFSATLKDIDTVHLNEITKVEVPADSKSKLTLRLATRNPIELDFKTSQARAGMLERLEGLIPPTARTSGTENLRVFCGTFNCGDAPPPYETMSQWLQPGYDLYVVAAQECAYTPRKEHATAAADWFAAVAGALGPDYVEVCIENLWEIRLGVYTRRDLRSHISHVQVRDAHDLATGTEATGVAHLAGNKGGVAAVLRYNSSTFCFVGSHLAAHQAETANRNANYVEILQGLQQFGSRGVDLSNQFDHVFWMGDLNYRIDLPREEVMRLIEARDYAALKAQDQLLRERREKRVFVGFQEGEIDFQPTYRYCRGSRIYSDEVQNAHPGLVRSCAVAFAARLRR